MSDTLGIDLGTSSIKVARFDAAGQMTALAARPFHESNEHDVPFDRIWHALTEAIREVAGSQADIAAIGLSSQTNSFALIDRDHQPLTPVYLWTGDWANEEANQIAEAIDPQRLADSTGMTQLTGQLLLPKCRSLKTRQPELWSKMTSIQLLPDLVTQRLCGQAVTDPSLWSLTGLYDLEARSWWRTTLDMLNIGNKQLPILSSAGATAGQLSEVTASQLSLPASIPVAVGALDHLAAAVGVGNVRPGLASLSTGTATCIVVTHASRPAPMKGGVVGRHPADPELWYALTWSGLSSAGLTWYSQQVNRPVGDLLNETSQSQTGADGWKATPRDPNNGAAGFDFHDTTPAHRDHPTDAQAVAAILECLTNEIEKLVHRATGDTTIKQLIAIGGGAQSDLWLKMIARQLGVPVARPQCIEASALGAARFAALAAGQIDSLTEVEPKTDRIYPST